MPVGGLMIVNKVGDFRYLAASEVKSLRNIGDKRLSQLEKLLSKAGVRLLTEEERIKSGFDFDRLSYWGILLLILLGNLGVKNIIDLKKILGNSKFKQKLFDKVEKEVGDADNRKEILNYLNGLSAEEA